MTTLLLTPVVLSAQELIAFESQRDGNPEVYVVNLATTIQRRLTFNSSFVGEPAFSPTGEKIAFSSDRHGNSEIYIMDADGSLQTNLTNNAAFDARVGRNTTTYIDATVANNTQYSFRMRSFNTVGASPYTNVVSAKTPRR